MKVRAKAYDLVLNGVELGGGSIRIHRRDLQQRIFKLLGLSEDYARDRFGFLLDAFEYGAPPHGGIALGIDRLAMLILGLDNIRDVITFPKTQGTQDLMTGADTIRDVMAFPKTATGGDPLTGAPTPITAAQRKEAGVDAKPMEQRAVTDR